MTILAALKGISGEFELNRMLGAAGTATFIVTAPLFEAWAVYRGQSFDIVTFAAGFGAGLAACITATAGAVAIKDRNVATARVTNALADAAPDSAGVAK